MQRVDVQDLDECERLEEGPRHFAETEEAREILIGAELEHMAEQVWRQPSKESCTVWRGVRRHRAQAWVHSAREFDYQAVSETFFRMRASYFYPLPETSASACKTLALSLIHI